MPARLMLIAASAACAALCALAPSAALAAPRCQTVKPTAVRVVASGVPGRVTVTWRAPRHRPRGLAFRVTRDGVVIGQTRGRRMSVAVRDGSRAVIKVTAYVAGRRTRCSASVVRPATAAPPLGAAGAVVGLSVRPGAAGRAVLSWNPAVPGAHGLSGYRLLRDGKTRRRTRLTSVTVATTARSVRYQVAALDRSGRRGPLSSVVVVKAGHVPPAVPAGAALDIGDSSATLSWGAARAIGAAVAGYRVTRDGLTVKATSQTSVTLPLPPAGRTQTYRVLAVDSWGWASAPSDPLTFEVGHRAPGAPGAPSAQSVTDTSVSLTWAPAQMPYGTRLRGYRVMRDGLVVAQVPSERADIGNLPAKSSHDWTVAAVDTTGVVSAVSAATRVDQADPPATAGAAQAFLLASTDASFAAFRAEYRHIGVVYPTFYECDRQTAAVTGTDNPQIVQFARDRHVKVLPRFDCQSTTIIHQILTDPATRKAWLDQMVGMAGQYGYDGVNLDFEAIAAADRDLLTAFVADLSDRLHAAGMLLSQAVSAKTKDVLNHPRSTAFNYPELAKYDDWVFVMAWGIHYARSSPGAQDDLAWVTQVANYVATMPNKQKFVMGTMLYGMDWAAGGGVAHPGDAFFYPQAAQTAAQHGVTPALDPTADSWHMSYTDAGGVPHDVWYPDARTVGDRIALARDRGLGVGFWRLGQEDARVWDDPRLPAAG